MPKSKQMCVGCRDNFYNGNNDLGVIECWNYKSAKIVSKKKVPYTMIPPWNMHPIKCLDCYHENGYAMIDPKRTC
jgi:hypothetical protein